MSICHQDIVCTALIYLSRLYCAVRLAVTLLYFVMEIRMCIAYIAPMILGWLIICHNKTSKYSWYDQEFTQLSLEVFN